MAFIVVHVHTWILRNGVWTCKICGAIQAGKDTFLGGSDDQPHFHPGDRLFHVLYDRNARADEANQGRAAAYRGRSRSLRMAAEALASKGLHAGEAVEMNEAFAVGDVVVSFGAKADVNKPQAIKTPAQAACVARVLVQEIIELEAAAGALEAAAWSTALLQKAQHKG